MNSTPMTKGQSLKEIGAFLLITILFTTLSNLLLLRYSAYPPYAVTLLMWSVGLGAITTLILLRRPTNGLGWNFGAVRYHGIALALPLLYAGVAYFLADFTGLATLGAKSSIESFVTRTGFEEFGMATGLLLSVLFLFFGAMPSNYINALGEEIGWRGFLTPRANIALGFVAGTLLTGLIWTIWHMPLIFIGGYNAGGDPLYEISAFTLMVVSASGIYAWLRMASGSLWPAATFHAAHNLIIQKIFDPLITRGETHITITGEFGIMLAVITVFTSIPFWFLGLRLWREQHQTATLPPAEIKKAEYSGQ